MKVVTVLVLLLVLPQVARAEEEPALIIRHVGGGSSVYFLPGIERLSFEGDTVVVMSGGGVDTYPAGEITRIDFNLEFSGIQDPEHAAALLKAVHLFQKPPTPAAEV